MKSSSTFRRVFAALEVLVFLVSFAACSVNSGAAAGSDSPVSRAEALRAIADFKLLNERGEAAPAVEWTSGRAPFGVLLRWDSRGLAQCNVSHLVDDLIGTNAHCLSSDPKAIHQVRFYDRSGRLQNTIPVANFKLGKESFDDVALLKIPRAAAQHWDAVADNAEHFKELLRRGERSRGAEPVVIWAADPLEELGAQFMPRQCTGTVKMPRMGTEVNGQVVREVDYNPSNKVLSPDMHLFLSGCSRPTIGGNSGALITTVDFIPRGIFSWELPRSGFSPDGVYRGADGEWVRVADEYPEEKDPTILQFGSRLFPFLNRNFRS